MICKYFITKISVQSQSDVFVLVAMMLMYAGCMVIGVIQDLEGGHNLEWHYICTFVYTAIPTLVFNFDQLFFMLVSVLFSRLWTLCCMY